jgi:hypothetical protein
MQLVYSLLPEIDTRATLTLLKPLRTEWDEYGAAGSSSEYTIRQVISKEALSVPMNGSQADLIFHRAFNAVGPGKMWLSQDSYLPLFGTPDSLATEVKISQWTQAEGLRCELQFARSGRAVLTR